MPLLTHFYSTLDNKAFFNAIARGWDSEKDEMDWGKWAATAFEQMSAACEMEQESNMPGAHVAMLPLPQLW